MFLAHNQPYAPFWQRYQLNPFCHPMMFLPKLEAPMGTLQHQVDLSQQQIYVTSRSSLTFSSAGPVFSSVNTAPSTSHNRIPIHSVTQQPTTVHTPVTTVRYNSQQKLLCDISTDETSTSSQVAT